MPHMLHVSATSACVLNAVLAVTDYSALNQYKGLKPDQVSAGLSCGSTRLIRRYCSFYISGKLVTIVHFCFDHHKMICRNKWFMLAWNLRPSLDVRPHRFTEFEAFLWNPWGLWAAPLSNLQVHNVSLIDILSPFYSHFLSAFLQTLPEGITQSS